MIIELRWEDNIETHIHSIDRKSFKFIVPIHRTGSEQSEMPNNFC